MRNERQQSGKRFIKTIGNQEQRKLRSRKHGKNTIWLGMGYMGIIGWSVSIPTVAGALVGISIDHHFPSRYSWTLMLLVAGLLAGAASAWRWVAKQHAVITKEEEDHEHMD